MSKIERDNQPIYIKGSWIPTFSNVTGVNGTLTLVSANYQRVGIAVTFRLHVQAQATSTVTRTSFNFTLPVAQTTLRETEPLGNVFGVNVDGNKETVVQVDINKATGGAYFFYTSTAAKTDLFIAGTYLIDP